MGSAGSRSPDPRRLWLNERLRRLKTFTGALIVAAALGLWWLVGGTVAATQARPIHADQRARDPFFSQQQPSLGVGNAQVPALRSGGS